MSRCKEFKDFHTRILVATNLFRGGMDVGHVNIVLNYDIPEDTDTYLHRVCVMMDLSHKYICYLRSVVLVILVQKV